MKLSAYAAQILSDARLIELSALDLHRMYRRIFLSEKLITNLPHISGSKEYESRAQSTDPLSGGVVEIFRTIVKYQAGIAQIF